MELFKIASFIIVSSSLSNNGPSGGMAEALAVLPQRDPEALSSIDHKCGIWLAESSIPNSGFGIFTTKNIYTGDTMQPYPNSPSIVVANFYEPFDNNEEDWNHVSRQFILCS